MLSLALLLASTAIPVENCSTVTVTKATVADIPALTADAACYGRREAAYDAIADDARKSQASARASRKYREARIAELKAGTVKPELDPVPLPSPTLAGLAPIADNFDTMAALGPSWGTGAIPVSAAPDVVGAFRFICGPAHISYDDPIVFPGEPGKSHGHQFYGNPAADAFSVYSKIRANGDGTCGKVNRSLYWMPWMLDGQGHVVQPDYITVYYKRRPISDPKCSLTSGDPQAEGNCVPIPNGLKFIFGWDPTGMNSAKTGAGYFNCDGPTGTQGHYATITEAAAHCPTAPDANGKRNRLGAVISAPSCWDGKNLDVPDHRSHVGYPSYGSWGYLKCDAAHPYVIPTFQQAVWYTVDENLGTWRLSSDDLVPGAPPGFTLHADYREGWSPTVKAMWTENCIDKLLNCSGGDLGNGLQIKGASQPSYGWVNPNRLVPVPPMPAM